MRGPQLKDVSLWDFCTQVEKLKKGAHAHSADDDSDNVGENVLGSTTRKRPTCGFLFAHEEHQTHCLKIRQPHLHHVPVLVGSILRHDQDVVYPKYCGLMLILFKPWCTVDDLQDFKQFWPDAFTNFRQSEDCTTDVVKILDIMQFLHESKDSHNDHFSQRHVHNCSYEVAPEVIGDTCHAADDFLSDKIDKSSMLEHLEAIESWNSE
ncbi:hypothetical protein L208DRAFT_1350396 [Tricholoma matsutake]|nr:hypothetical protein L208DRAFT_1350396 [Tricholoma matsutake 945]